MGLELFDYFINNVEVLCSRADSVLLMSKARSIREVMVRNGVPEGDIPKLEGAAGKSWFRKREEGENLRKQKHAANEKRLAAKKQQAETLVLSLSWGTYVDLGGVGVGGISLKSHVQASSPGVLESQITCEGFQPTHGVYLRT